MNKLEEIIKLFDTFPLTDIWLVGFVDEDENSYKIFHSMQSNIYLEFESIFLRCTSINQYDQLSLDIVTEIKKDIEIDEDDDFCISSIIETSISDIHRDNYITSFRAITDENSNRKEGIVKYLELRLDNDDTILLDPANLYGIKISSQTVLKNLHFSLMDSVIEELSSEKEIYDLYTWNKYKGIKNN